MITVEQHTFNPFQENTYLLYDETKEAVIIDAGNYTAQEKAWFEKVIKEKGLKVKKLISTHSHLDHIFGNKFIIETFKVDLLIHKEDLQTLMMLEDVAQRYGIPNVEPSPMPSGFIDEGDKITFGNSFLDILFVPGHAPGHLAFVSHEDKFVINGDCLFMGSIGRTDLPGGNHQQLLKSIEQKLFTLPEDYKVYCGHGPATTVGYEKKHNPFF